MDGSTLTTLVAGADHGMTAPSGLEQRDCLLFVTDNATSNVYAFARDGRTLFATETAIETGDGVLGIYDAAADYRRRGEVPTHGLDPHEVRLMPDGRTLVIANGGILTHPDAPGRGPTPGNLRLPADPSLERR